MGTLCFLEGMTTTVDLHKEPSSESTGSLCKSFPSSKVNWSLKMGRISCTEKSVTTFIRCGRSLKGEDLIYVQGRPDIVPVLMFSGLW